MQARRHQYLSAMGIQVWQLRDRFPGDIPVDEVEPTVYYNTAVLADSEIQAEALSDVDCSEGVPAKPATSAVASPAQAADHPEQDVTPEIEKTASVSHANAEELIPEFRLASVIFPNSCMVVTEVPVQGTDPLTPSHLLFLKNVLSAVDANFTEEPLVTFFNWPMLRSPGFDQGEAAARQASQAFLSGQKSKHDVSFILLMGQETGRYLLPDFVSFSDSKGRLTSELAQPLLMTHSIAELFDDAALKADVWCDLQPLRLSLNQDI